MIWNKAKFPQLLSEVSTIQARIASECFLRNFNTHKHLRFAIVNKLQVVSNQKQ